ncbi:hypothetical protein S140_174 [Shewanella sp. phage 1/40]|uniref:Rz-like spanin n=1 Tax=Shewanella phage 1/4 TaxID=1458859 RepID=UPI0004F91EE6|nr:Rz-like spanin [Shewanella sp. phage 1/4]YP_009104172.1 Rz-like spanin [Shewanella sp. phage 1/40]AHK11280.1 hypothetical protein S14_171 [Shewanella sp. phage 1/4]AHK11581.1 hypothetical protein S140_174 [Shewanella sp. phage 1/40]
MEILVAIGVILVAIVYAFVSGKSSGKDSSNIKVQSKVIDNVQTAKEISGDIDTLSDDDVRDRLRKRNK